MSDAPERIYLNLGNEETTYAEAVAAGWEGLVPSQTVGGNSTHLKAPINNR